MHCVCRKVDERARAHYLLGLTFDVHSKPALNNIVPLLIRMRVRPSPGSAGLLHQAALHSFTFNETTDGRRVAASRVDPPLVGERRQIEKISRRAAGPD